MEKQTVYIIFIFATIILHGTCTNPNNDQNSTVTRTKSAMSIEPIDAEQEKSKIHNIKGRKSAGPVDNIKPIENKNSRENISQTIKDHVKLQKASETGVLIPSIIPVSSSTENVHHDREGISEKPAIKMSATTAHMPTKSTKSDLKIINPIVTINDTKIGNSSITSVNVKEISTMKIMPATAVTPKTSATSTSPAKTSTTLSTTTSTTTTSTTSTSTTTTTTTTTTPKPKKPQITYSIEDMPTINKNIPKNSDNSKLNVNEPDQPIVQPSKEFETSHLYHARTDYIIPVLALIFAVPIVMGAAIVVYRRLRDYWSTRHYRRMDFLVDGMYND